jgi:hypothetical protein
MVSAFSTVTIATVGNWATVKMNTPDRVGFFVVYIKPIHNHKIYITLKINDLWIFNGESWRESGAASPAFS